MIMIKSAIKGAVQTRHRDELTGDPFWNWSDARSRADRAIENGGQFDDKNEG